MLQLTLGFVGIILLPDLSTIYLHLNCKIYPHVKVTGFWSQGLKAHLELWGYIWTDYMNMD